MNRQTIQAVLFISLSILLVLVFVLQLLIGSISIPIGNVLAALTGGGMDNEAWRNIIVDARLPGALAALFAGAGLSVSGLQMQTLFRNPVAGPLMTVGISEGASLGVAVFVLASSAFGMSPTVHLLSSSGKIIAASCGAMAVFLVNFVISFKLSDVVAILIIGLMIGGAISAFIDILQLFSGNEALKSYILWTFGSFRDVDLGEIPYLMGIVAAGIVFSYFLSKPLNLMLLGDTYAVSSGLNLRRSKALIVICTSVLAGCITAFCGPVAFVGLAVPHVARSVFKTADHRLLTPATAILGGLICCLCNILASKYVLPVNSITSILGAPVVIWIILKQRKV